MERDVDILRFIGRTKLVRAEHIGIRFGTQRSKSYQRLQVLRSAGLIARTIEVPGPAVYHATRAGLALSKLPLGEARLALGALVHDLALTEAFAHLECAGLSVLTERELRAGLRLDGETPYRIETWARERSLQQHWPDLVVLLDDQRWIAIEAELSEKAMRRTEDILNGYARTQRRRLEESCIACLYLVPNDRQRARLIRLFKKLHLDEDGPVQFHCVGESALLPAEIQAADTADYAWQVEADRHQHEHEARRREEAAEKERQKAEGERYWREQRELAEAARREAARPLNRLKRVLIDPADGT